MPINKNKDIKINVELDMDSIYFENLAWQSCQRDFLAFTGTQDQLEEAGIPTELFPNKSTQRKTITSFTINGRKASLGRRLETIHDYELLWEIPEDIWPIEDPDIDSVIETLNTGPANFKLGEVCIYWKPGHSAHGERMEITQELAYYKVLSHCGRYIDEKDLRFDYCRGYWARAIGESPLFYEPHELRDPDFSVRHIRLVVANKTAPHDSMVRRDGAL